jgi:hypothetical protein
VLRPAGPLPPRVYWIRRGFILLGVLILILIIAEACSGGSGKPAARRSPTGSVSQTPSTPQPCTTAAITVAVGTDHDSASGNPTYTIGESPKFTATFTNVGSSPCTLTYSKADETWTVISGTTTIWTTKGCTATTPPPTSKTTTLQAGGTKKRSITWTGKEYSKCQPSADLQPGQYVVRADLDGHKPKSGTVFQMTAATGG